MNRVMARDAVWVAVAGALLFGAVGCAEKKKRKSYDDSADDDTKAPSALAKKVTNKDDDILTFVSENDAVSKQIRSSFDTGGVVAAQKTLDEKKVSLRQKFDAIKNVRSTEVKKESMTKLTDSATNGAIVVCGTGDKKLCDDYTDLLKAD